MPKSHNGWPVITTGLWPLPAVTGSVKSGPVWTVLNWLAREYAARVEKINRGDSWGYAHRVVRGGSAWSNHASGTAVDFNASRHPMGRRGTMTAKQATACRQLERDADGVLNWGDNIPDEMHWEIAKGISGAAVEKFATKLLQRALNARGAKLVVDGIRGDKTLAATKEFQTAQKLTADAVDGPKTWAALAPSYEQPPANEDPTGPQDPDPKEPTMPSTPAPLTVATLNCHDPRFGGSTSDTRVEGLAAVIVKSEAVLVALTECPDDTRSKQMRTRLRKALPGDTKRWKVWTADAAPGTAILFDIGAVKPVGGTDQVKRRAYGKGEYHGSIAGLFDVAGILLAFGGYHLQPNSIASLPSQEDAVQATAKDVLALKGTVSILAGDGVNSDGWLPGWTATRVGSDKEKPTYKDAVTDRIHIQGGAAAGYRVLSAPSDHQAAAVTVTPISTL